MGQPPDAENATRLVGVQFDDVGKVYDYDPGTLALGFGDRVVVATERGTSLATVVVPPRRVAGSAGSSPKRVIKKADHRDLARAKANQERATRATRICLHRIRERGLDMKLLKTECMLDGSKIVFYFTAEGRVDFRELVRDLAHTLGARIEMRQVGSRDETKIIGGVGPCGRELCCACWLREFTPVLLNMAKKQGLSLKPTRLTGMCGRLKCCLRYEYDTYVELGRLLPAMGKRITCPKGAGVIVGRNVLRQTVLIKRDDDGMRVEAGLDDIVARKPE